MDWSGSIDEMDSGIMNMVLWYGLGLEINIAIEVAI